MTAINRQGRAEEIKRQSSRFAAAVLLCAGLFIGANAQQEQLPSLAPAQPAAKLASGEFISQQGLSVEQLVERGLNNRADLLAARGRLAVAAGRLQQARLRLNPTFDAEFGSPRFLGGEPETDLSIGVTQVFEIGGKRARRIAVADLELQQARAEVHALERGFAAGIRQSYTNAVAAARQLDVLENLIAASQETLRATEARLQEGDVAPLDANLVRVENDRLKIAAIAARSELDVSLLEIRALVGADLAEDLPLAAQTARPPRLDLSLAELTRIALENRADLLALRIGEELGTARVRLAGANRVPNVAATARFARNKGITDLPARLGGGDAIDLDNELTFGVAIEIPIFNRSQGEISVAAAEQAQAARNREFLEATIRRDVATAYRRYRAAAESLVLYSTQILPRSEENLRSVRAAYGFGEFSVFDVVNEQRRLTDSVTGYNQSLRDYYNALTELEIAAGTALPAAGFAPADVSVLPDAQTVPQQIDREKFLKSLQTPVTPQSAITPKTTGDTASGKKSN